MSKIAISHKHSLNKDEAKTKLDKLVAKLEQKYKISYTWNGDEVLLKGTGVKGKLAIAEGKLDGFVEVPFIVKKKVEKALDENLKKEFPA